MTTDRDPPFEGKLTEHGMAYTPGRVESRVSGRAQPDTRTGSGLGTILTSSVLALLVGGAGAWAYVDYLRPLLERAIAKESGGRPEVRVSHSGSTE